MCRSLAEGGRRCPHQGYSSGRENQAARQQLSRARRRLVAAQAAGDTARITKAQAQVAAAQARVGGSKPADTAPAPATAVSVVDRAPRAGAPARKPAATAGAPAAGPGDVSSESDPQADAAAALERVRAAGGLAYASDEDLTLASQAGNDYAERESFKDELRVRAGRRVREAAAAAAEADRSLDEDRYDQVRDAINASGAQIQPGDWMRMSELRDALPLDMSRAEVDATLKRLSKAGQIHLAPDPARFNLQQSDHENAIHLGGEDNHLIVWDRTANNPAPSDQQVDTKAAAQVGDRVQSEYGMGEVTARTPRSLTYRLDSGEVLNVAVGTPGYDRVQKASGGGSEVAAVATHLRQAATREEAADSLAGLTKKELAQVAAACDYDLPSRMRKADQIDWLYRNVVGARQDHEAIRGGSWRSTEGVTAPSSAGRTKDVQTRIQEAFDDLTNQPGGWVSLTRLRSALPDVPRNQFDKAVADLALDPSASLIPEANQKTLTSEDRAAALFVGGEDKHLLSIRHPDDHKKRAARTEHDLQREQEAITAARAGLNETTWAGSGDDQAGPRRATANRARPAGRKKEKDTPAQQSVTTPAVLQVDGPPVDGWPSRRPLLENRWGDLAQAGALQYHSDGAIGLALGRMGGEARMAVDGEPLHNVLGRVATEVVHGKRTAQEGVDAYKTIRDRLPERSQARSWLDSAIQQIDAPRGPAPVLPADTPEPLRQLSAALHAVPICRAQPERELEALTKIVNDAAAGKLSGFRLAREVDWLRDKRHESDGDAGYFEIQRAVAAAADALRKR